MYLIPTDCTEVQEAVFILENHKSEHLDGISGDVLKFSCEIVAPILTTFMNKSCSRGKFPDCLKITKVLPIHKSGARDQVNNYRLIPIFPVISKVFEKITHQRIYSYYQTFELLLQSQFGFRSRRYKVDAITEILEKLQCTEKSALV